MTIWGMITDGTQLLLGAPEQMILDQRENTATDLLKLYFPVEQMWEPICSVSVHHEGKVIFGGIVDEQHFEMSSSGKSIFLVCRSYASLLIDNEAMPQTIQNPSLNRIYERFLRPLGIRALDIDRVPHLGEMSVNKGESCWHVLEYFCRRFLKKTPVIDSEKRLFLREDEDQKEVIFIDDVISARLSHLACEKISSLSVQGSNGAYETEYKCSNAVGVLRKRYLSTTALEGVSPSELMERAENRSFQMHLNTPGFVETCAGERVTVELDGEKWQELYVERRVYRLDKTGETTEFLFRRG